MAKSDKARVTRGKKASEEGAAPKVAPATPVERLFAVLTLTAEKGAISAADLIYAFDLPRPTAHRLIGTLEALSILQKMPAKGKYAAAPRMIGLAAGILKSAIVYSPIKTLLAGLAEKTGETCGVALMAVGEIEYVASVMGPSPLTLQFQAGQKAPLHCTSSGLVLLAYLQADLLENYLATGPWESPTGSTAIDPKTLRERVRRVRIDGYAANVSEYIVGVAGAAVPITGSGGQVVAALTLSAPKSRKSLQDIVALVPLLRSYAGRIGRTI